MQQQVFQCDLTVHNIIVPSTLTLDIWLIPKIHLIDGLNSNRRHTMDIPNFPFSPDSTTKFTPFSPEQLFLPYQLQNISIQLQFSMDKVAFFSGINTVVTFSSGRIELQKVQQQKEYEIILYNTINKTEKLSFIISLQYSKYDKFEKDTTAISQMPEKTFGKRTFRVSETGFITADNTHSLIDRVSDSVIEWCNRFSSELRIVNITTSIVESTAFAVVYYQKTSPSILSEQENPLLPPLTTEYLTINRR